MDEQSHVEMAGVQQSHWWFRGRRRILAAVLSDLGLGAGARVLEAGCGPGGNLEMLATFGQVHAFEPHAGSRHHAATTGWADVRQGSLPHRIPFDGPFDLIVAFDVLEHVEEDSEAVATLARLLGPAGRLVVTVPAYPWLWSAHDERLHHKRRYTARSLHALLSEAGLRVERLTYFNSLLLPAVVAARLLQRITGSTGHAGNDVPQHAINKLLEAIFSSEARLLRATDLPAGVSILAIANA